ncbi:uncharacterized protein LOC126475170 [Schistocerca serialis cubense]|uniref:uncharacterized protein LOC126475170 n=1 Tax=Schistocerca serialis cubense TaxID=2023355 RepID=UPI00214F3DC1|nr:uncharacterized protein LOC126475170 [Schistocerca serialis cubense]
MNDICFYFAVLPEAAKVSSGPYVTTTLHPGVLAFVGQPKTLNISEITWLGGVSNSSHVTLEVNGTAETYELAFNKTESQLEECATPGGGPGQCRHLANCVLPNFTGSLDDFLPYLCVVDGSYVGACCPDNTVPPTIIG